MTVSADPMLLYLWDLRTLSLADGFDAPRITTAAHCLWFGLERDLEIGQRGQPTKILTRSALIPAGATLSLKSQGQKVVSCYLDPVGQDFQNLKHIMTKERQGILYDSNIESQQLALLNRIYQDQPQPRDAYQLLLNELFPPHCNAMPVDDRVWEIIKAIKREPTVNHSNQYFADQLNLTQAQLRNLFKQTTGISIRRYRTWHRLFVTATLMFFGRSLTDAALQAGFSDSSHFNHAFREMIGMKPSAILKATQRTRLFIGGDNGV